jgi:hypothetical protein
MLRTKQRCQIDRWMIEEKIGGVTERVIDRRLVADKRDTRILQCGDMLIEQTLEAKFDLMSAVRHLSNQ